MPIDETCQACAERDPQTSLHPDVLARLTPILGVQLVAVFSKHQQLEAKLEMKNVIGRQNLVEALSHISALFQRAADMDRDEQLEQVAYIEDHLRRVMMETFEILAYDSMAELIGSELGDGLERHYYRRAAPLIKVGKLVGHITPAQYEKDVEDILQECVSARKAKVADGTWADWNEASADLQNATKKANELRQEVVAAIDAAHESWRFWAAVVIAVVLFFLSLFFSTLSPLASSTEHPPQENGRAKVSNTLSS